MKIESTYCETLKREHLPWLGITERLQILIEGQGKKSQESDCNWDAQRTPRSCTALLMLWCARSCGGKTALTTEVRPELNLLPEQVLYDFFHPWQGLLHLAVLSRTMSRRITIHCYALPARKCTWCTTYLEGSVTRSFTLLLQLLMCHFS